MQDAGFFTDVHAEVLTRQPPPCDAEIVAELLEMEDVSNDTMMQLKVKVNQCITPQKQALKIIKTMQKFSLFSKHGAIVQSYVNHVAYIINQHFAEKSR